MKNVVEILKGYGIEIPEDKIEEFNKEFHQNYKTVAEYEKKVGKLETECSSYKEQLEAANATLKDFEDVDADGMKQKIKEYEDQIAEMKKTHEAELYSRDFSDALSAAMEGYKFTSEYARKSIMQEIQEAGLKMVDGKIIGLGDMIDTIKEKDASAFVDEETEKLEENKAKFTIPMQGKKDGSRITPAELMKMKNENPDMDISQYIGKGE